MKRPREVADPPGWGDLLAHLQKLKVPPVGIEYVRQCVATPERVVQSQAVRNVTGSRPSVKTDCLIQSESHTLERPFFLGKEADDNCIGCWDQPPRITYPSVNRNGRNFHRAYTPDALCVMSDAIEVTEVKSKDDLELYLQTPTLGWTKTEDGQYENKAISAAFAAIGIVFKVWSPCEGEVVHAENLALLLHHRNLGVAAPSADYRRRALGKLRLQGATTLSTLADSLGSPDVTPLLQLVDAGVIAADLRRQRLSSADTCYVALTSEQLGETLDAFKVFSKIAGHLEGVCAPSPKKVRRIASRLDALNKGTTTRSARTLRRYRKTIREKGVEGLGSDWDKCGLRGSRLGVVHDTFIRRCAAVLIEKKKQSIPAAFRSYSSAWRRRKEKGMGSFKGFPVVERTFRSRCRFLDAERVARRRGGRRAANSAAPPTDPKKRGLGVLRPFERAHLDHYHADIFLYIAHSGNRSFALRPWVTVLIDEATSMVLAFTISLGAPSRKSVGRVLRDCARRHGRLPESIMTDWGADFESVFYRDFLARYLIESFKRPVTAGRWGSAIEKLFDTFKTLLLRTQPGFVPAIRERRSMSSDYQPENDAQHSLVRGYELIRLFIDTWLNPHARGLSTKAPTILMAEGLLRYPNSGFRVSPDDLTFLVNTSVPAPRESYKLISNSGIRMQNGQRFSDAILKKVTTSRLGGLLLDCEDDTAAYTCIDNKWYALRSGQWRKQVGLDPVSTTILSIRRQEGRQAIRDAKDAGDSSLGQFVTEQFKQDRRRRESAPSSSAPAAGAASPEPSGSSNLVDGLADLPLAEIEWA